MDQITVPQFIENEDRILGPITVRQFVILLVAAALIFVAYKTADFSLFVFMALLIGGCTAVLAFFRVNGQPFHFFLLNIIRTAMRPSLRVWRKEVHHVSSHHARETKKEKEQQLPSGGAGRPSLERSRLSELSLIVDTGGAYRGEGEDKKELF